MQHNSDAAPSPAGRRLQHLKLVVVVPLTMLGLLLGAMLLQHTGDLTPTPSAVADFGLSAAAVSEAPAKVRSTCSEWAVWATER